MKKLLVLALFLVSFYSNSQSLCGGSTATLTPTNPSGLGNPQYSLNPGGFSPDPNGNFVVSPGVTTTYTIYTTGTNTNNVTVTTSVVTQVTVNPQPFANPSYTQASCTNSVNAINLGLTFSPAAPSYTISWSLLPNSVLSPQQQTATSLPISAYTVQITAAGGCSTAINFTILPQPAPANFSVLPFGGNTYSVTCATPTVLLNANNPALSYTWSSSAFVPVINDSISLDASGLGTLSVVGQNTVSNCTSTFTFLIKQDVAIPSTTISPNLITISCGQPIAPTVTLTSNPIVNISHYVYSPQGGTFTATSFTTIYSIGGTGTYTHCLVNNVNGCSTCKEFTVTSNDAYPTYTLSSPNGFTLGCSTRSLGTINIVNAAGGLGGAVSYTIIGPPTSASIPPAGNLSASNSYTMNVPGTWTVIVRDNANLCETRTSVSVLQNIFPPGIAAVVPRQILDCTNPSVTLQGVTTATAPVSYNWSFVPISGPGNVLGNTITAVVNATNTTQTLVNNFTLTIKDLNNECTSFSVVPIYQNIFPPKVVIAGDKVLTCLTNTVVLTNQSSSGIPPASGFPVVQPIIGYLWSGPSPQEPLQVNTTYVAGTVGTYTLVAKDLNNGCTATGNFTLTDNKVYPQVTPVNRIIDCGAVSTPLRVESIPGQPNFQYVWTQPPGSLPATQNGSVYSVSSPGNYTVVVTNTLNSCKIQTVVTAQPGTLTADFTPSTDFGYAPLHVEFTNNSTSETSENITSLWSFGNGVNSTSLTPSVSVKAIVDYTQPGTYTVSMYVTKGACQDTLRKVINVEIPSYMEIPNVFTPNDDKVNDLFFINGKGLSDISITIVDRWGHIVYEVKSGTGNVEWDGKNQYGKESAEGAYFYVIKAVGKDGKTFDKKGTVNLYR